MGAGSAAVDAAVLVVGAGPTGLSLALELAASGVDVRVIDAAADAVHESRALAVQARTLELLARHGVADRLASRGDRAATLVVHAGHATTSVPLFDDAARETAFPYLLFVSQATTERVLLQRLAEYGVPVERGTTLVGLEHDDTAVRCVLARADRSRVPCRAKFVVGCDGAHSMVRKLSGTPFHGTAFPQSFVLADLEADGLRGRLVHAFVTSAGIQLFFPLGAPATWRTIVMRPPSQGHASSIDTVQRLTARYTGSQVRVRDPVWLTDFSVHSRCATSFRAGRVLLAGDAAHIHSPAGAQGMNTGIQDAVNLGWKLAMVCDGRADAALLDTYDAERRPIARTVIRTTNRAFRVSTSSSPLIAFLRPRLARGALAVAPRIPPLRRAGFRRISELAVHYRRGPLAQGRGFTPWHGPRAGDRFPDGPVTVDGIRSTVHAQLAGARFHLVLCGSRAAWPEQELRRLISRWPELHHAFLVTRGGRVGDLVATGTLLRRLRVDPDASVVYLVRPDGYIAARGADLRVARVWLARLVAGAG